MPVGPPVLGKVLTVDWRLKAGIQKVLSVTPGGQRVNFVLQTRVTHGVPVPDSTLLNYAGLAQSHIASFDQWGLGPLDDATFFEFGAGWDLRVPIMFRAYGVRTQIVVDRSSLATRAMFEDVLTRLCCGSFLPTAQGDSLRRLAEDVIGVSSLRDMTAALGIDYRAPVDAADTKLDEESIDCVTSTSTLEHIPPAEIHGILAECIRVLRPGGLMSMIVDYSDHFSHFDSSISPYNFLRYDDRHWARYNSALNYQNRLRHSECLETVRHAGFEIVDVKSSMGPQGASSHWILSRWRQDSRSFLPQTFRFSLDTSWPGRRDADRNTPGSIQSQSSVSDHPVV